MPGQLLGGLCLVLHHGHSLCCSEQSNTATYHTDDIPHGGVQVRSLPQITTKGAWSRHAHTLFCPGAGERAGTGCCSSRAESAAGCSGITSCRGPSYLLPFLKGKKWHADKRAALAWFCRAAGYKETGHLKYLLCCSYRPLLLLKSWWPLAVWWEWIYSVQEGLEVWIWVSGT